MGFYNDQNVVAPLDKFGADPETWNVEGDWRASEANDGSGRPGIILFSNALQVWASLQASSRVTVGEAAAAFFVTPNLIVQAVEDHLWMGWDEQDGPVETWVIGHDGE